MSERTTPDFAFRARPSAAPLLPQPFPPSAAEVLAEEPGYSRLLELLDDYGTAAARVLALREQAETACA